MCEQPGPHPCPPAADQPSRTLPTLASTFGSPKSTDRHLYLPAPFLLQPSPRAPSPPGSLSASRCAPAASTWPSPPAATRCAMLAAGNLRHASKGMNCWPLARVGLPQRDCWPLAWFGNPSGGLLAAGWVWSPGTCTCSCLPGAPPSIRALPAPCLQRPCWPLQPTSSPMPHPTSLCLPFTRTVHDHGLVLVLPHPRRQALRHARLGR